MISLNLIIFIIIIYGFIIIYHKRVHKFWGNQPVSKFYYIQLSEGIISNYIEKPIINNNFNIQIENKLTEIDLIKDFLNQNYYQNKKYKYIYNYKQLSFLFNPLINYKTIKIKNIDNNLIGFISSRDFTLSINGYYQKFSYVDLLCTHQKYRNYKLAPLLISNIRYENNLNNTKFFMFKIELNKLPFNYLSKLNYYQLNLNKNKIYNTNINLIKNDNTNFIDIYNFFNDNIKKYSVFPVYSLIEFTKLFCNKNILTYTYVTENKINGLAIFNIQDIEYNIISYKTVELIYFIDLNNNGFFESLINTLKINYDFIICIDIMNNYEFIKKFHFEKGVPCYLQLYNYHVFNCIEKNQIGINFL